MASKKTAARAYQNFERFFRLVSMYKGQKEQLEQHVKVLQNALTEAFKESNEAFIRFDFSSTGVHCGKDIIFQSERPETTLAYTLFCEGVQALVVNRDINAHEVLGWCGKIRDYLVTRDESNIDLASILWKSPFPNIRIYIYSLVLEGAGAQSFSTTTAGALIITDQEPQEDPSEKTGSDWDLPQGDLVLKQAFQLEAIDEKKVNELKQSMSGSNVVQKVDGVLSLKSAELKSLGKEFSSYDTNHIEFNLTAQFVQVLGSPESTKLPRLSPFLNENLSKILQSVLDRFHGALLLFYLKIGHQLKRHPRFASLVQKFSELFAFSFKKTETLNRWAQAFEQTATRENALKLFSLIPSEMSEILFLNFAQLEAQISFLKAMKDQHPDLDKILGRWTPDSIAKALPLLPRIEWPGAAGFITRCFHHRSPEVLNEALSLVGALSLPAREAIALYDRLNDQQRTKMAECLLDKNTDLGTWKNAIRAIVETRRWENTDSPHAMNVWTQVILKCLQKESEALLKPYLNDKKFFFWYRHPRQRTSIIQTIDKLRKDRS